jgi:ATP-dependent RNA helicase DeaD
MRPGDLVGAIANETNLVGRQIGPIRITDTYSVVGVPEGSVDEVINALRSTVIRGRTPTVRPYSDNGAPAKQGHRGSRPTFGDKPTGRSTGKPAGKGGTWNRSGGPGRGVSDERPPRGGRSR